jgi:hypothetical protein
MSLFSIKKTDLIIQTLEGLEDIKQKRTTTSKQLLSKLDKWKKHDKT